MTSLAPLVWGSTYLVTSQYLPPGRPLFAACVRALPAGVLLVLLARRLPHGMWWWRSAVLGVLNIGAFFALLFIAAYRLPGGVAATVIALQPLLVAALSARLLAQRLSVGTLVAALAGIGGVALMVLRADARLDPVGLAAALAAAAVMATGVVLTKRWSPPVSATAFAGWQLCAGGLFLLPVAVLVEGPVPPSINGPNLLGYAYLSLIGAALTYPLWFRGIRSLTPTSVTFLGLLSPVVATALGWLALGQDLTGIQLLGAAIVLASIITGQVRSGPAAPTADSRAPGTPAGTRAPAPADAGAGQG